MSRPAVLVIAGTDSSGGAGLTRDVQVLTDFGADALCVVTAVTAQSNSRVAVIHHIPPEVITQQIAAAFETRQIAAVKIGMLGTRATVEAVAAGLPKNAQAPPIVLDPVLVSSSGGILLDADGRAAMQEKLFPRTTVATPNVPEVAILLSEGLGTTEAFLIGQAERLLALGPRAILLKGGHAGGLEATDLLVSRDFKMRKFASPRIRASCRGTGCAMSSAVAAGLAFGAPLDEACQRAKRYIVGMLTSISALPSPM